MSAVQQKQRMFYARCSNEDSNLQKSRTERFSETIETSL